jgi:hypothetical protein
VAGIPLFLRCYLFTSPLRFAEYKQGVYGSRISRRCLRRKLPFLSVPWQVFIENLSNEFGDEPKILSNGIGKVKMSPFLFPLTFKCTDSGMIELRGDDGGGFRLLFILPLFKCAAFFLTIVTDWLQ